MLGVYSSNRLLGSIQEVQTLSEWAHCSSKWRLVPAPQILGWSILGFSVVTLGPLPSSQVHTEKL